MFKQLGVTDEVTDCDCCGRSGLKRTVVLESDDTGIVHFGVDCASKALAASGVKRTGKTILDDNRHIAKANAWIGEFPIDKISNWLHTRLGLTPGFDGEQFFVN